jgi:hypothetical protein
VRRRGVTVLVQATKIISSQSESVEQRATVAVRPGADVPVRVDRLQAERA